MEAFTKSTTEYISSNPFAPKQDLRQQKASKPGKRPRIQKPVYSVRLN